MAFEMCKANKAHCSPGESFNFSINATVGDIADRTNVFLFTDATVTNESVIISWVANSNDRNITGACLKAQSDNNTAGEGYAPGSTSGTQDPSLYYSFPCMAGPPAPYTSHKASIGCTNTTNRERANHAKYIDTPLLTGSLTLYPNITNAYYANDIILYVQLNWTNLNGTESGSSFSQLFGVTTGPYGGILAFQLREEWDSVDPTSTDASYLPDSTSVLASSSTATISPAASSQQDISLSTGAVAGIAAAGGAVVLALIGTAVWFMCFRRRGSSGNPAASAKLRGDGSDSDATGTSGIMLGAANKGTSQAIGDPHHARTPGWTQLNDDVDHDRHLSCASGSVYGDDFAMVANDNPFNDSRLGPPGAVAAR